MGKIRDVGEAEIYNFYVAHAAATHSLMMICCKCYKARTSVLEWSKKKVFHVLPLAKWYYPNEFYSPWFSRLWRNYEGEILRRCDYISWEQLICQSKLSREENFLNDNNDDDDVDDSLFWKYFDKLAINITRIFLVNRIKKCVIDNESEWYTPYASFFVFTQKKVSAVG